MTWKQSSTPQSAYILIAVCMFSLSLIIIPIGAQASSEASISRPDCQDKCGGIPIPYPFGIGKASCFNNTWFELTCQTHKTHHPPKLFSPRLGLQVFNISYKNYREGLSLSVGIKPHITCTSKSVQKYQSTDLRGSPFKFSAALNVFVMQGCSGTSSLINNTQDIIAMCTTDCKKGGNLSDHYQGGVNFCQSQVTSWDVKLDNMLQEIHWVPNLPYLYYYEVELSKLPPSGNSQEGCLVATLMDALSVKHFVGKLSSTHTVPVTMEVTFTSLPGPNRFCSSHGPVCQCANGYEGNAYMTDGCKVMEACRRCGENCIQGVTGYYCLRGQLSRAAILGISIGPGLLLLAICCYWMYRVVKRRWEIKKREENFKRNGGLLLQQQLSSNKDTLGRTKVFTSRALEKASDNFNNDRILGQGGQGTVYKGMLTDGRIVAIKKSKLVDESQIGQFINELLILSQVNHRNVVKVLGCCLETEVPLLVYEFIPNGTLSQHIHDPDEDFHLTWEMRLKIAYESACAIAYLHSSSSPPIYHRDIKTSNILLDEKNRAKVSDFGSSKTIALDQTHLTTVVQGTMGYLDPEYFQSYQFTEKSDVYSFGVVLLELLTNKKPFYRGELLEQKTLVTEFLYMMETSIVIAFLDPRVVKDVEKEVVVAVARLAKRCLSSSGRMRPKMKEVAAVLEMIIGSSTHIEPNIELKSFSSEGIVESYGTKIADPGKQLIWSSSYQTRVGTSISVEVEPLLFNTR